jgi:hypothetical protein
VVVNNQPVDSKDNMKILCMSSEIALRRAPKEGLGEEFGRAIREAPRPAGRGAEHTISEGV